MVDRYVTYSFEHTEVMYNSSIHNEQIINIFTCALKDKIDFPSTEQ